MLQFQAHYIDALLTWASLVQPAPPYRGRDQANDVAAIVGNKHVAARIDRQASWEIEASSGARL